MMQRRIYVSCGLDEQELADVHKICQHVISSGAEVDFAPDLNHISYSEMERAIEQCDTFLAVFAATSEVATSLAHAAQYAFVLNKHRLVPRPRLFGVLIHPWQVPRAYAHIPFEWLSVDGYENLLQDVPLC